VLQQIPYETNSAAAVGRESHFSGYEAKVITQRCSGFFRGSSATCIPVIKRSEHRHAQACMCGLDFVVLSEPYHPIT
jgi:hypothetical protein